LKCHKVEINYTDHLQCQSVRRGGNCHDRRIGNGRDFVTLKGIYIRSTSQSHWQKTEARSRPVE